MIKAFTFLVGLFLLVGCAHQKEVVCPSIPEAWLLECDVPALPDSTGDLSGDFIRAAQCAIQGNKDKARIRDKLQHN